MTSDPDSLPVLVCALPEPPPNNARTVAYAHYVHEILAHAGLCYLRIEPAELSERLAGARLLVTVGDAAFEETTRRTLTAWVQHGGAWIGVGGTCGLHELFGVEPEPPAYQSWGGGRGTLGEGYLAPGETGFWPADDRKPLHFFNGAPIAARGGIVHATALDAHGRATGRAGVVENPVGSGRCLLIAPDLTGSIVRIQQGVAVTRDGIASPDGTGPIADGVLKSDDGAVLDWLFDRNSVPGVPGYSAFLRPAADRLREVLLRSVFHMAAAQRIPLALLWLYPRGLPAIGHLSHDTDGNDEALARRLLDVLDESGARATWCVILPGYPPELIAEIRECGHELATHFDAMSEGTVWSEHAFESQYRLLAELFGEEPVSNKNHYLRWEGDVELLVWCERRGIRLDQSKGASKTGEAGFNFGTCHPYTPVARDGRIMDVLELCTPTQDIGVFAPEEIVSPLLDSALRHHGILHLLFHPAHIDKPGVAQAIRDAVARGRAAGLEWWTAGEIATWETARRAARWRGLDSGMHLEVQKPLPGATLLVLAAPEARIAVNGKERATASVERWGVPFHSLALTESDASECAIEVTL